jgi:hypothetical protein
MSDGVEDIRFGPKPAPGDQTIAHVCRLPPGPRLAEALSVTDPSTLTGRELVEVVAAHHRLAAHTHAGFVRAVHDLAAAVGSSGQAGRGNESATGELAFALSCSEYAAEQALAAASLAIDVAPDLISTLEAGDLDEVKLKMLTRELSDVDDPASVRAVVGALRTEFDRCTVSQLRTRLRVLLLEIEPEAVRTRHARSIERRRVEHHEFANGTSMMAACYLPKDRAAAAWAHIDAIAQATVSAGDPLHRRIDQIRADVFADLLAGVDPSSAGATKPGRRSGAINLHIGLTTLACLNDHPGSIPGFGPVLADIARQAAEQMSRTAQWRFSVENIHGETIADCRLRRRPTVTQRAFVAARDGTCRAPGCTQPAIRCDIDHVQAYAEGGPTTIENLQLLCRRHHRFKHKHGFTVRRSRFGTEWTTSLGVRYIVLPSNGGPPREIAIRLDQCLRGHKGRVHLRR